jgi:hypothetical protein
MEQDVVVNLVVGVAAISCHRALGLYWGLFCAPLWAGLELSRPAVSDLKAMVEVCSIRTRCRPGSLRTDAST